MKNIHVLPTSQPSRLFKNKQSNLYSFRKFEDEPLNNNIQNQNIYITSDEEIKRPNYVLLPNNEIIKLPTALNIVPLNNFVRGYSLSDCKKIILTTDQDLIADGIQAIDDEFLKWICNNPSCEEVEVANDKKLSSKDIYDAVEGDLVYSHHGYGGIINSLSKDVRVGIDNYIETAITSETGWETLDINNYKIYDKCYKIIIPIAISRCCGRCDSVNDLCYTDMCCEEHSKYGCEECYGPKVTYKINSTECGNKNCQSGVIDGINPKICKKCNPDSSDLYAEFEKWVNSNYTIGIQNKSTAFDAARFGAEWKEKQTNDAEMISLIKFLASDVMFTYSSLSEETAKFFLRRYKNSK